MKRKFLFLTVITLILAIGLEACAKPHEHLYSESWSSDETYHWHQPLCDDAEPTKEKHTFNEDKCIVCGYERESSVKPGEGENPGGEQTPGEGENPGGEQTPGEGENPGGEQTPGEGETPGGEQTPGEGENPGGEQTPGEGENPGGEQTPGEEQNPGGEEELPDTGDGEYEEPDENVDIEALPDKTVKPDQYYTNIEDVFKDVEFQDMTDGAADVKGAQTQSEVDKAWATITQTLRNIELGKGFAFGDILIDESRHQAFYSAIAIWQFKGLNGSINNATKLNVKEVLQTTQYYAPSENSTYYANMHGAYEMIDGQTPKSYRIEKAAAYVAQDIFDSFRYHLGEFQYCIGATEKVTKKYARSGDYYYIQVLREVEDSSSGIALPINTTMQAAYYKGYLVAFRHNMKYLIDGVDMSSDAYILVTEIKDSIARPQETYTPTSGAPSWVPIPHKNLDPGKDFTETDMQQVTTEDDAFDAYNVFGNSVSQAGYGFDYIAPRGDVQLKTKNAYSETEITFDKYSADGYLIHKTTKGRDFEATGEGADKKTVDCEQYLDGKYIYQRIKRGTKTDDGKATEGKYLNEGYSDYYSNVLTYDITENIMMLLSGYCEAVSEHLNYDGSGSYLPAKNFELFKKVSGDYTIYLIKFSNKSDGSKENEPNSTEFTVYYAFDSAGMLCGASATITNTDENGNAQETVLEFLVGSYKVTIPDDFKQFKEIKHTEDVEDPGPYLDF